MKRYFLYFFLLIGSCIYAQQPSAVLSIEDVATEQLPDGSLRPATQPGQPFTVAVTLKGLTNYVKTSDIGGLDQFDIINQQEPSLSITIINGKAKSQQSQRFTVKTDKEGIFTLGPLKLQHQGATVESNTVTVRINKDVKMATQQSSSSEQGAVLCRVKTSKQTVLIGEPLVATITFYVRGSVINIGHSDINFPDFSFKQIKQATKKEISLDGKKYLALEQKFVLMPLKEGTKEIAPLRVIYTLPRQVKQKAKHRGFFGMDFFDVFEPREEEHQTQSNGLKINVIPLPTGLGQIDGVGSFTKFTAQANKQMAIINEPITITLTLEGKADLEHIPTLKLNVLDGFKYYESKNSIDEDLSTDYIGGKKHFEYVVQAAHVGSLTIPSQEFRFYDTTTKMVKTIKTNPIALMIKQGEGQLSQQATIPQQPQQLPVVLNKEQKQPQAVQDINFIVDDAPIHKRVPWSLPWWLFIILLIVPVVVLQKSVATYLNNVVRTLFKRVPCKKSGDFEKKLNDIIKRSQSCALHPFFLHYLAVLYGVDVQVVTEDWIAHQLQQSGWPQAKIDEFIEYMGNCAQLMFVTQQTPGANHNALLKKAQYWFITLNASRGI